MRVAALLLCLVCGTAAAADFPGFSLSVPEGERWQQVQRNAASIVWMKRTDRDDLSFLAAVLTRSVATRFERPGAFVDFVRREKTANPDPARYAVALERLDLVERPARPCVRYASSLVDRSVGNDQPLILRIEGLTCLHPAQPERMFDVQFSLRAPAGIELPQSELSEGEAFLAGFGFAAPPADGRWALGSGAARRPQLEST